MKNHFRTEIKLKKGDFPGISYKSKIALFGSCFSDEIGNKFRSSKIPCLSNPFGTTYNPVSIQHQLRRIVEKDYFNESDLMMKKDLYNSYELHSSFDNLKLSELLNNVNNVIDHGHDFIKKSSHLYITLGTSRIYEIKGKIVNNCHKKPASEFTNRLLSVEEVVEACASIIKLCKSLNIELNYIFTVSPVRHLKDGLPGNSLSKSILRVAIGKLMESENIYYFPANEILNDDLRDYRFFDEDLVHPNGTAVHYIWNQILESQVNETDQKLLKNIEKLNAALNHRSFNPFSRENLQFINDTIKYAEQLQNQYPQLDFKTEIETLKNRLPK